MSVNVVFIKGSLAGMRFHIPDAGTVVGRSHSCGIRASESDVSGRHVQIVPAGNGAEMTVLSAHRAFVNGRRVPSGAKTSLKSGDHIRLGESLEFAFQVDNSAASSSADSTALFPEVGEASGGTRATVGTRATMATQAVDEASTSDVFGGEATGTAATVGTRATMATAATMAQPPRGIFRGGPRSVPSAAGDTTATFPTGVSTSATHLPGEEDAEDGETQVLKTQMVSREELEQLGQMYAEKRRRRAMSRGALLGVAFLAVFGGYMAVLARKPENPLSIPGDARKEVFTENLGEGGVFGLKVPAAPDLSVRQTQSADGGTNVTVRTRLGAKWDVDFTLKLTTYRDSKALHEPREATFDRWVAANLVPNTPEGDFTDLGLMSDNAFVGSFGGTLQGIRCLSREYGRTKGDTYYGVVSFFRYGDRCYVLRREVIDAEKGRAEMWLLPPGEFMVFDAKGKFVKRHWEGIGDGAPIAHEACKTALLRCEEYLAIDSPADWKFIEQNLYRVLAAAAEADDVETSQRALSLLVELRDRMSAKWKGLWAERTVAANSGDKVLGNDVDRRVRAVFWDRDDARHGLCRREKWWRRK